MITLTCIRHAEADKSTSPDNHRKRLLSEAGINQAHVLRERLGNPEFDLVCHSILPRTEETARIVAGINDKVRTTTLRGLFYKEWERFAKPMDDFFDKLGNAPLSAYDKAKAGRYTLSMAQTCVVQLLFVAVSKRASNILVVGHGVILPAFCRHLCDTDEPFTSRPLGNCEGYQLTFDNLPALESVNIEEI